MESRYKGDKLCKALWDEWANHPDRHVLVTWKGFIASKDLGVEVAFPAISLSDYIITDEKKWMLTKLKYGI